MPRRDSGANPALKNKKTSLFSHRLNSDWDGDSVPFPGPSGPLFGEIVPPAQSPGPQSPRFPLRICLSSLTGLPGGKSARYAFLLRRSEGIFSSQGIFCSAKMLLAAYIVQGLPARCSVKTVHRTVFQAFATRCGFVIRGRNPPDHPHRQKANIFRS